MEEEQIECGNVVLEGAQEVLADQAAGEVAVRFALTQAALSLRDVLLVAHSRGAADHGLKVECGVSAVPHSVGTPADQWKPSMPGESMSTVRMPGG